MASAATAATASAAAASATTATASAIGLNGIIVLSFMGKGRRRFRALQVFINNSQDIRLRRLSQPCKIAYQTKID